VRVDLRSILHAVGRDAEGVDGPPQVFAPFRAAERQALAQRRLVDLNDADSGALEIQDLLADRERELIARDRARLVVAHEGPVEDRDRAGQHALHRLVGQRLRVPDPLDRHRLGTADVAEADRRLHAARAVGLHPAVLAERIAAELLAEVLDHVVAVRLAEREALLFTHRVLDLLPHRGLVGRRVELARAVITACLADLRRLRKRTDRRGRELGQPEGASLQDGALSIR